MITVSYDDSDGLIRTVTYGSTARAEIEDYLLRLYDMKLRAREEWGRIWHLVDAVGLEFQSDENMKTLAGASLDMHIDDDRTAVVMLSSRAIRQVEEMPSLVGLRIFGDFRAAKDWLEAEAGECPPLAA